MGLVEGGAEEEFVTDERWVGLFYGLLVCGWLKTGRDLSVEKIAQESLFTFVARKNGVLYGVCFNRVLLIGF